MDANALLAWIVSISCLALIGRAAIAGSQAGWVGTGAAILGLMAGFARWQPELVGWVGSGLWVAFVLLPTLGARWLNRLMNQERWQAARRLAAGLRWLHPGDGWWQRPQLMRALEAGQQGYFERAFALLQQYRARSGRTAHGAQAILYRMGARWETLLRWLQQFPQQGWWQDPVLAGHYLRALGELGDLNGLVWGLHRYERQFGALKAMRNPVRALALALCARPQALQRALADMPHAPHSRAFWHATAALAAGDHQRGQQQLQALQSDSAPPLANAIAWRLAHPPANPQQTLDAESWRLLDQIERQLYEEARYGKALMLTLGRAGATYATIGLNIAVFALESALGGSTNAATLERLGALQPAAVWWGGEWWRLLAANFLHFGPLHLAANMLGLYLLGPYVERTLGAPPYCLAYAASGVGAMGLYCVLALQLGSPEQVLVGASSAIMGLLGVTGTILLWGWCRERSRIAAQRLQWVVAIVAVQASFDLSVANVSFMGHVLGLAVGSVAGSLLLAGGPFRR